MRLVRLSRTDLGTLAIVLVAIAFYAWTASTSTGYDFGFGERGPSNLQAEGFQEGQLAFAVQPPAELARLADPYDPEQHGPVREGRFHDFSYYDGKLYSAWGPAPVLTLFLPARLLGLGDVSERDATLVFALISLLAFVALLRLLVRRLVPQTPAWMQLVGVAVIAFGDLAPYLLRRPVVYEVASAAGMAFLGLGLLLLLGGLLGERRPHARYAVGSFCLGLAAASRPTMVFAGAFVVGALVVVGRRGELREQADRARTALALVAPLALCLLSLALFNWARFDSALEFGQRYQLGVHQQTDLGLFNFKWALPGLWFYLLAPVRWSVQFPFFWPPPPPDYPFGNPKGYYDSERTSGLLTSAPIVLALLAAPLALRGAARPLRLVVGSLAGLGGVVLVFLAGVVYLTTMRYEADFLAVLLVAALLSWFALHGRLARRARKAVAVLGAVAAAYGMTVAMAASVVGVDNALPTSHPGTYFKLERFFSPLPTLVTQVFGRPVVASLDNFATAGVPRYDRIGADGGSREAGSAPVTVKVVAPRAERARLSLRVEPGPAVPPGTRLVATVRSARSPPATVAADGTPQQVAVRLRQGLNELSIAVTAPRGTVLLSSGARATVADVRVVRG